MYFFKHFAYDAKKLKKKRRLIEKVKEKIETITSNIEKTNDIILTLLCVICKNALRYTVYRNILIFFPLKKLTCNI